jgi:GDPmannose 4,6-dehydratase
MARTLIVGISGQDGAYLARLLQARGDDVWGTTRSDAVKPPALVALGIADAVTLRSFDGDHGSTDAVAALLDTARPDAIYHLAGGRWFEPAITPGADAVTGSVVALDPWLETLGRHAPVVRFFAAVSAEAYDRSQTSADPAAPRSAFVLASASAVDAVAQAREQYGLFAVAGLLFSHESRFAPRSTPIQRIIAAAHSASVARSAADNLPKLVVTHADLARDCGWAPEYVDAMTRTLALPKAGDHRIATGKLLSISEILQFSFDYFGLDWTDHVRLDPRPLPSGVPALIVGDPLPALAQLGWRAHTWGRDLIDTLCEGYAAQPAG